MGKEFPHKFNNGAQSRKVVQNVASASRSTTGRSSGKKQVRLTNRQVAIAKKLGVPLEEYAKYVKE
jgi:phage I-like protein